MELDLKFQLLFVSSFLFRLVRRLTKVAFVVSVNTAVTTFVLFIENKSQELLSIYFLCLAGLATKAA